MMRVFVLLLLYAFFFWITFCTFIYRIYVLYCICKYTDVSLSYVSSPLCIHGHSQFRSFYMYLFHPAKIPLFFISWHLLFRSCVRSPSLPSCICVSFKRKLLRSHRQNCFYLTYDFVDEGQGHGKVSQAVPCLECLLVVTA